VCVETRHLQLEQFCEVQPAQLGLEVLLTILPPEEKPKIDGRFFTSCDSHSGQFGAVEVLNTSFSNSAPHLLQVYS